MSKLKRIKEICDYLDADVYGKRCNFIELDLDNIDYVTYEKYMIELPTFYSRDLSKSITFKELLKWYLPRLGNWIDEPICYKHECEFKCKKCDNFKNMENCEEYVLDKKIKNKHYDMFIELIEIYSSFQNEEKYNELKNKLEKIINEN